MSRSRLRTTGEHLRILFSEDEVASPHMLRVLDGSERERFARLRQPGDKNRFAIAAHLLRVGAGEALGIAPEDVDVDRTCETCTRPHGRPRLPGTGYWCSISHSGAYVVVVLASGGPVGVDVEDVREHRAGWRSAAAASTAPNEKRPVDFESFLREWTAKEAVLKLTGDGLGRAMSSLELASARTGVGRRHGLHLRRPVAPSDLVDIRVATDSVPGAILSLAVSAPSAASTLASWHSLPLERIAG